MKPTLNAAGTDACRAGRQNGVIASCQAGKLFALFCVFGPPVSLGYENSSDVIFCLKLLWRVLESHASDSTTVQSLSGSGSLSHMSTDLPYTESVECPTADVQSGNLFLSALWGRTVRCTRAVHALCEKLAVLHHREFGKFRRLKGRH